MIFFRLLGILIAATYGYFVYAEAESKDLAHWPPNVAAELVSLINQHAHQQHYAVFDMDNTSYRYDLTEYLLVYLEKKN